MMALSLALIEAISIFAVVGGAILAWLLPLPLHWIDVAAAIGQGLATSLCCVVAFYYSDLYNFRIVRSFGEFVSRLPLSFGLALCLLAPFFMILPKSQVAAGPFVLSLLIILGLILLLRAVFYGILRSPRFTSRVLILGTNPLSYDLIRQIDASPYHRYAVVGVVHDTTIGAQPSLPCPLLGPLEHLDEIVEEVRPDGIIVALTERWKLPSRQLLEFRLRGIFIEDGVEVYERLAERLAIEWHTPQSLIFSKDFRKSRFDLAAGRALSLFVSVIGLVVFAPLFGLIALAIRLDSRGGVLFVQDRVGLRGRPFQLLKFRTMHPVRGKTSEWVRDNGHRITRVGKWLRKFRLDELPQFVNVLRGDMNLVGPRPHPVSNFELFALVLRNTPENGEAIPYYSLRCVVRPGITGWAQIRNGYANGLEEEIEKMRYDLYYIKYTSLWFDLRILFDTVKTVLLGHESLPADASWTKSEKTSEGQLRRAA